MTLHKWVVGFVLAVIMVSALFVNALLFSSRNFQFNLAQMAPATNGVISVDHLLETDAQIDAIQKESADQRGGLIQIERQLSTISAETEAEETRINTARAEIAGDVATIEARTGEPVAESAALLDAPALQGRIQALAARPNLPPA
ncbi:MAG: hypothetical protein ABW199_01120, partial [Caulobacterales bacterium]